MQYLLSIIRDRLRYLGSKYSYHFIHIPKNGGSSIRGALYKRRDVSTTIPYHYRYRDIVGVNASDLRYFCVIRNPWSRTASRYLYAKQNAKGWSECDPRRVYISKATFEDFVRDQRIFPVPNHPAQPWMGPMSSWFNQLEWVKNENNIVMCDCLRLEHLDEDMSAYFGESVSLPYKNVTKTRYDYRDMYTDELTEIIGNTFEEDIGYFGFSFDGAATRNICVNAPRSTSTKI